MLRRLAILAVLVVIASAGGVARTSRQAAAQGAITIVSDQPRNEFPRGVSFTLSFTAPSPPKEVRIRYRLAPDGTGATAIATCNEAATVNCTYTLTSGAGIFIIPGAEITYHWEIEEADGARTTTPDRLYVHEDTRFTFQTLMRDNITLYYHAGSPAQAQAVLDATAATLRDVGALEKAQVTFPVKVFLYTTADEMQPAIAPGGQGRGVQILGEVVYSDTAMVSADVATIDIVRHEVAHIVTREATKGPFGIAAWMNEGISVFSQTKPLAGHDAALQTAIRADRVLSIKELNSSASGSSGSTVGLYYGQAGSMIKFLVDTYGPDKFAELLKTFKEGSTPDKAFEAVYGFDQLGYENAWRQSVGLEPRSASSTATPENTKAAAATATPKSATSAASSSNNGGTPVLTIAIIVALTALLLAAIVGAGTVVMRRR